MNNSQYPEKPMQAHYNLHQQQQQQFNQQPTYLHTQNQYSTQPYPYANQPPMVYVQPRPPQQSSSRDESSCLACACLAACCWATFCWPCICCL